MVQPLNRSLQAALFPLLALLAGALSGQAQQYPRFSGGQCREGRLNAEDSRHCDPHDQQSSRPDTSVRPQILAVTRSDFVSFTTLAAPKQARKAYERAGHELDNRRPDFAKAARYLEQAVSLYPRFAEAWRLLGETRFAANEIQLAADAFRAALAADPKYPDPYVLLAEMELRLARIDLNSKRVLEAARLAEQVLKMNPQLSMAHYHRAFANLALGNRNKSEQSIRAIIDDGEDGLYPMVHAMLAELRACKGDARSAVAEYRRFLELEPSSPAADEVRARLAEWQATGRIR
jgi:tetratricopeptide (TPR) repeat protein